MVLKLKTTRIKGISPITETNEFILYGHASIKQAQAEYPELKDFEKFDVTYEDNKYEVSPQVIVEYGTVIGDEKPETEAE